MECRVVGSGSSGNSYIIKDGEHTLILDAGCKFQDIQKALDFQIVNVDGCLITHSHKDHCEYVEKVSKCGIDCYAGAKAVEPIYSATGSILKPLLSNKWSVIGKWIVIPLEVKHDVPCYGFIIITPNNKEKLAYFTDFSYIGSHEQEITLKNLDIQHWLIAVNYSGEPETDNEVLDGHIYSGHSSLDYVKRYLTKSMSHDCKTIIACHLSSANADAEVIEKELNDLAPQCQIGIAKKGMVFEL